MTSIGYTYDGHAYCGNTYGGYTYRPQVRDVFDSIGVDAELQSALFQTMSGVMHLGNISLAEGPDGNTTVSQLTELKNSSKLLCTHEARLVAPPHPNPNTA